MVETKLHQSAGGHPKVLSFLKMKLDYIIIDGGQSLTFGGGF